MINKNIYKLSASKLLKIALSGEHLIYCPHKLDKIPGYECLCWKHEVKNWDSRVKLASAKRVRKTRPQKIHFQMVKPCAANNHAYKVMQYCTTSKECDVTCKRCLKIISKKNTISNKKNNVKFVEPNVIVDYYDLLA